MNLWKTSASLLEEGRKLYLLTVIESLGSAPGRRGFKMLVADDQRLFGSIGGGIMEFNLVEKAKALLASNSQEHFIIEQTHSGQSRSSSGMICSGSQVIAFTSLDASEKKLIDECIDGEVVLQISPKGLQIVTQDKAPITVINNPSSWHYTESLNRPKILHLFGAGHVSLPTSRLLKDIGFEVFLYDNRVGLNTFEANQYADHKQHVDYQNILQQVNINAQDHVVLMTNKFTEDKLLLSQLLGHKCQYLGVLGSANKIDVMFAALQKSGHSSEELSRVSAPIGLPINSQTVEEIAISIAAEIIQLKNDKRPQK